MGGLRALAALGLGAGAIGAAIREKKLVGAWAITGVLSRRPLIGPVRLPDGVAWWDDWFTVEKIDENTWAIGEPRYYQLNHSYLLLGTDRALLFDSGPGMRPIGAVVRDLTDLPVTVVASHLHFDHVGGHEDFDRVAMFAVPGIVEPTSSSFTPSRRQHLGAVEAGSSRPTFSIADIWRPGDTIDLGARRVEVIHAPGHTEESVCIYDPTANTLFTGDMLYDGELLAALPGSDLHAYRDSAAMLADVVDDDTLLLGAHTAGERPRAPRLERFDLVDLAVTIEELVDRGDTGPGRFGLPRRHYVNDRMNLFVA